MRDEEEKRRDLMARIEARRSGAARFLRQNRPGIRRRANITIVLSSLAAIFTAGPAIGGGELPPGGPGTPRLAGGSHLLRPPPPLPPPGSVAAPGVAHPPRLPADPAQHPPP